MKIESRIVDAEDFKLVGACVACIVYTVWILWIALILCDADCQSKKVGKAMFAF